MLRQAYLVFQLLDCRGHLHILEIGVTRRGRIRKLDYHVRGNSQFLQLAAVRSVPAAGRQINTAAVAQLAQ